jgi:hypothetical protein
MDLISPGFCVHPITKFNYYLYIKDANRFVYHNIHVGVTKRLRSQVLRRGRQRPNNIPRAYSSVSTLLGKIKYNLILLPTSFHDFTK